MKMKALVFAAGLGTRLRPLTDSIPKALVEVGGVPVLERVIRTLAASGVEEVVVTAHHFADKIETFLSSRDFGVKLALSAEPGPEPLETGGGMRNASALLKGSPLFLAHNADILSNADLRAFAESWQEGDLASLVLEDKAAERMLLFDSQMRLAGWTNTATGEIRSPFPGLDPSQCRAFSFCGIHLVSEEIFALMEGWPCRFGIIDFYLSVCRKRTIRGYVPGGLRVFDIGTPESLEEAQKAYSSTR
ncbi:MAG: NTP transferase domain-containing protein [Candidatus Cryptobacteroides sp.]|nr:NTP transferase domain-containing protein [Candidatus Cryptobacteroides sp.]